MGVVNTLKNKASNAKHSLIHKHDKKDFESVLKEEGRKQYLALLNINPKNLSLQNKEIYDNLINSEKIKVHKDFENVKWHNLNKATTYFILEENEYVNLGKFIEEKYKNNQYIFKFYDYIFEKRTIDASRDTLLKIFKKKEQPTQGGKRRTKRRRSNKKRTNKRKKKTKTRMKKRKTSKRKTNKRRRKR
jgi:hypothetical protein